MSGTVDSASFRGVAGLYPTGVTVVTAAHEGRPCGLTVNSFATVSIDPPLVLICLAYHARARVCVDATGRFAVNVLSQGQEGIARVFADKAVEDKFADLRYTASPGGSPLLEGICAWMDCEVVARHPGGRTHTIYVATVAALGATEGRPLLFHRGTYSRLPIATAG